MQNICSDDCRQSGTPFDLCPEEKEVWALEEERDILYKNYTRQYKDLNADEKAQAAKIHDRLEFLDQNIPRTRCDSFLSISYDDPDMFCYFKGSSYTPYTGLQVPVGEEKKKVDAYLAQLKSANTSASNVVEWLS